MPSHTSSKSTTLTQIIEAEKAAGSSDEMLVPPSRPSPPETEYRKASTPPPTIPLPPLPTSSVADNGTSARINSSPGNINEQQEAGDGYTFPYALATVDRRRSSQNRQPGVDEQEEVRMTTSTEALLVESPCKSPSVVESSREFPHLSAVTEHIDGQGEGQAQVEEDGQSPQLPAQEQRDAELHASLSRLRTSSSSPLSELVTRLSLRSPTASMRAVVLDSTRYEDSDAKDAETGASDTVSRAVSPFSSAVLEEDSPGVAEEALSVDGSSGISVAAPPPTKSRQLEATDTEAVSNDRAATASAVTAESNAAAGREHDAVPLARVSPTALQRWSIAELEAAYGRMRRIATSRKGSGVTDAPSLLLSETDDSQELENSYLRHLLNDIDRSVLQSSQGTEMLVICLIGMYECTDPWPAVRPCKADWPLRQRTA